MSFWSTLKRILMGEQSQPADESEEQAAAPAESAPVEAATDAPPADQPSESSGDVASDITLDQARAALMGAFAKSEEMGVAMDIAVVDADAKLKAFVRMDGAWQGSIDIAQIKARTARFFDMPTGAIGELSQPGGPLFRIEHSNRGLISFPGGLPIRNGAGDIIGAIGVSGSTVEDDHAVAEAGVAATS